MKNLLVNAKRAVLVGVAVLVLLALLLPFVVALLALLVAVLVPLGVLGVALVIRMGWGAKT